MYSVIIEHILYKTVINKLFFFYVILYIFILKEKKKCKKKYIYKYMVFYIYKVHKKKITKILWSNQPKQFTSVRYFLYF